MIEDSEMADAIVEFQQADVNGGEVKQTHPHPHSVDIELAERSGLAEGEDIDREKVKRVYTSPSTTSMPRDGKPDSA